MSKKSLLLITLVLALLAFTVAAPLTAQDDLVFPIGEGAFTWGDLEAFEEMDLSGQELEIFGPWVDTDQELFESIIAYFEAATGADVVYSGSGGFEQEIVIQIEGGSPPNIAVFPQPGLAADLAGQGALVPLGGEVADYVLNNYAAGQSWVDLGTYENAEGADEFFALAYKVDVKSLVWYSPDNFADAGYEVPQTMEDLIALTEQIVADGATPWCIGIGSAEATGWPATDWVEDIMLRTQAPEVYDQWVTNELPFNSPEVVNAIETFGFFAKNDAFVDGGAASVASTTFQDSPDGLFSVPPRCYMHRQASFIPSFFPEDVEVGVDADFFYFPSFAGEDLGNPVLGGGTMFTITEDNEAARAFIDFLTTPLAHELWLAQISFLTPHTGVNLEVVENPVTLGLNEILLNATTFRFDGSDLMPGAIGAGAFWTGMVDFVNGEDAQTVADAIQTVWEGLDS
ncbi:MAG: ABC transporter substrate-binding protein [Anaerolineae bacterium]